MKIQVIGAYGEGNFGDDALMLCIHGLLKKRFASERIKYTCESMPYILLDEPNIVTISPNESYKENFQITFFGGGTQFFSFKSSMKKKIALNFKKIKKNALLLIANPLIALKKALDIALNKNSNQNNCNLICIGIGIGPFEDSNKTKERTKKLLKQAKFISARDLLSEKYCLEFGINNYYRHSDLCFDSDFINLHITKSKKNDKSSRKIGIIVRDWQFDTTKENPMNSLLKVSEKLRNLGYLIEYIFFSKNGDPIWKKKINSIGENYISWDPKNSTVKNFLDSLNNFDYLITMRFHGAIFASLLEIPVVCVNIEPKLELISDSIGRGGRKWSDPFLPDSCVNNIVDLEKNYDIAQQCLRKFTAEQCSLNNQMKEKLADCINKIIADFSFTSFNL